MNPPYLIAIDVTETPADIGGLWERSRFLERARSISPLVVLWDPAKRFSRNDVARFDHFSALVSHAAHLGYETLVIVDGRQLFLDAVLCSEGLQGFCPERTDYFTQWEHCRLPVGVGVRAIACRTAEAIPATSPVECLEYIRTHPAGFRFHYDMVHQVTYEQSLLDSRDSAQLRELLQSTPRAVEWDMRGFLQLVAAVPTAARSLRYIPEAAASRVDERKMPAAYGFESPECADYPTYIMFDITNICNAKCIHCPQSLTNLGGGRPEFLAHPGRLAMETFRQVIDECAGKKIQFVRITADGEPLVHKEIFEMIDYAGARGVGPVGLTTNGSLMTPDRAERLLKSRLFMVDFSLDAATPATFEKVRAGLKFDRVMGNVHHFIERRRALGAPTKIMVSFVKQTTNIHELDAFRSYWEPLVDQVLIREMISNVGLNQTSQSVFPGWDHRWPCVHFFRRVVINHEGILKACPIDWEQKTTYKPMTQTTVYDAWHSHHYWLNRMEHLNDAIPDERVCKKCKDWAGTPWDMGYEKVIGTL